MLKAKDIMTRQVITVGPETTVEELGRLFMEKRISGAPVVDSGGKVIGVITENDLIRQNRRFHIPTVIRLFDALIPLQGPSAIEAEIKRMSAFLVKDICSKNVVTVDSGASLQDIATVMAEKNVHLLPVLESGRLVGIIGKIDVIRGSLGEADQQQS